MKIAQAIRRLASKRSGRVEVRMSGPRGEIHLVDCVEDTPLEQIAKLVQEGLLG